MMCWGFSKGQKFQRSHETFKFEPRMCNILTQLNEPYRLWQNEGEGEGVVGN